MDAETAMSQEQIRIRELETALEANRTLLVLESEKVRRIQHQFVCIGQELGGEQFDQWLKDHLENDSSPEELAAEIVSIVKASLGLLGAIRMRSKLRNSTAKWKDLDRSWIYRPSGR